MCLPMGTADAGSAASIATAASAATRARHAVHRLRRPTTSRTDPYACAGGLCHRVGVARRRSVVSRAKPGGRGHPGATTGGIPVAFGGPTNRKDIACASAQSPSFSPRTWLSRNASSGGRSPGHCSRIDLAQQRRAALQVRRRGGLGLVEQFVGRLPHGRSSDRRGTKSGITGKARTAAQITSAAPFRHRHDRSGAPPAHPPPPSCPRATSSTCRCIPCRFAPARHGAPCAVLRLQPGSPLVVFDARQRDDGNMGRWQGARAGRATSRSSRNWRGRSRWRGRHAGQQAHGRAHRGNRTRRVGHRAASSANAPCSGCMASARRSARPTGAALRSPPSKTDARALPAIADRDHAAGVAAGYLADARRHRALAARPRRRAAAGVASAGAGQRGGDANLRRPRGGPDASRAHARAGDRLRPVGLGPRVLRADTAPLAALACIAALAA